jgi:tetratricopeptide (TPR) repeat protein
MKRSPRRPGLAPRSEVTAVRPDAAYTLRHIEQMLGLGRSVITAMIDAGFVKPTRGARNEYRFTFQDVVLLRTAHALRAAKVPPRRLLRSLKQLRSHLPTAMPLSGLRITAIGAEVAVHEGGAQWEAESGQLLMDFEVAAEQGSIEFLEHGASADSAEAWFGRGETLEADDAAAAENAYRMALVVDPLHAAAAVNLAALLCAQGRGEEAVDICRGALERTPDEPLLHFNLAIALEDAGHEVQALSHYEQSLLIDPQLADAHFNAARLHERLGQRQQALRHYSAYRRLGGG